MYLYRININRHDKLMYRRKRQRHTYQKNKIINTQIYQKTNQLTHSDYVIKTQKISNRMFSVPQFGSAY